MSIASQWRRITSKPPKELAGRAAAAVFDRLERRRFAAGRLNPADRLARALGVAEVDAASLLSAAVKRAASYSSQSRLMFMMESRRQRS